MRLLLVEWIDSHGGGGWDSLENLKQRCKPFRCRSIGWEVARQKNHIMIAPHLSGIGFKEKLDGDGSMCIPLKAVTKIRIVKEPSL